MDFKTPKTKAVIDSQHYKDKFQFVLSVNDNFICQRYFKVNGFNPSSLETLELKETFYEIVNLLRDDLASKSRVYLWYTAPRRIKMNGFNDIRETDWLEPSPNAAKNDPYMDERPADGEFLFKFSFLVDEKPCYEFQWDGNIYPKFVRNSVDITNSDNRWKGKDPSTLGFDTFVARAMTNGKPDLTRIIFKKFYEVLSNPINGKETDIIRDYTYTDDYGDTTYYFSPYPKQFVNAWRNDLKEKTKKHMLYATNFISDKVFAKCES